MNIPFIFVLTVWLLGSPFLHQGLNLGHVSERVKSNHQTTREHPHLNLKILYC